MKPFHFEQGLATLFASENGDGLLTLLALAERAGLSQRIPDWLKTKAGGSVRRKFALGWLGGAMDQRHRAILGDSSRGERA